MNTNRIVFLVAGIVYSRTDFLGSNFDSVKKSLPSSTIRMMKEIEKDRLTVGTDKESTEEFDMKVIVWRSFSCGSG